jgi:hypothetical protein
LRIAGQWDVAGRASTGLSIELNKKAAAFAEGVRDLRSPALVTMRDRKLDLTTVGSELASLTVR